MSNTDSSDGKEVNVIRGTYRWKLEKFCVENFKVGEGLLSPVFTTDVPDEKFKWQLQLYPRTSFTCELDSEEYLSLYLKPLNELNIEPEFSIFFIDDKDQKILVKYLATNRSKFPCFMKNSEIKRENNYSIECHMAINTNYEPLTISEHLDTFEKLMENDELSDVSLTVAGRTFLAHKCILSIKSPVFGAMFRHDTTEKENNAVIIEDIDPDAFKEMLRFIYAGRVNEIKNIALNLFIAADKYSLDSLKDMCVKSLLNTVSVENAVRYLEFSDLYQLHEFKKIVLDFIVQHINEFISSPESTGWGNFKNLSLVKEVLIAMSRALKNKR